jgi:hypothetical protein
VKTSPQPPDYGVAPSSLDLYVDRTLERLKQDGSTITATGTELKVIRLIESRQRLGLQKYRVSVKENPAGVLEWCNSLLEELLDASIYLRRLMDEIEGSGKPSESPPA